MSKENFSLLRANLKQLRLPTMLAECEKLAREAAESNQPYEEYLLRLTELEVATRATNAPFTVLHDGGIRTIRVNQQQNGGEWNSLGSFVFSKGSGMVILTNDADSLYVIADAIRAVYRRPLFSGSVFSLY